MANGTIFDQTQETALTAAHRLLVQDTSAATASQSATFALMGGLEHNAQTVTTADITGAVGQLYYCTIAGLTADRNLTLPASAQVGERIGVYIVDGDATYELIIKGAATVTINGGSAATEWSRLFIAGEMVIFRCVGSTDWIVEYDGRIPCSCKMGLTANQTTNTGSTYTKTTLNISYFDVGGIANTTSNRVDIRRAGVYAVVASGNCVSSISADNDYRVAIFVDGSFVAVNAIYTPLNVAFFPLQRSEVLTLAAGSYVEHYFRSTESDRGAEAGEDDDTNLMVTEVFNV